MSGIRAAVRRARGGGVRFLGDGDEAPLVSWSTLGERAARAAGALEVREGEGVLVAAASPEAFLRAFLGVVWAGGVPVPLAPPMGLAEPDEWVVGAARVAGAAGARVALVDAPARDALGDRSVPGVALLDADALDGPPVDRPAPGGAPAFVQFTSGSTGEPRGIAVSEGALDANLRATLRAMDDRPDDVCVSWLPLYHDMGLVGQLLGTLWSGRELVLLPTATFLRRPLRWLGALTRYRGTVGFAPDFAYRLLARRATTPDLAKLDLRAWRIAGCGAEPVRADTLAAFEQRFAPAGFAPSAWMPSYGLAEHTLAATMTPPGRGARVVSGRVGVGFPLAGHAVRVVDEDGRDLGDGEEGAIVLEGPSVTGGPGDGVLATRDRGFLDGGELFVCGREADVIVVRGVNVHATDVERVAEGVDGVRAGGVVAFGVDDGERERLVALFESPRTEPGLRDTVAARITAAIGLPATVERVPSRWVPRTTSGKPRRAEARRRWLAREALE